MHEYRCHSFLIDAVIRFDMDPSNSEVLTEPATGYYALTPPIAGMPMQEKYLLLQLFTLLVGPRCTKGYANNCEPVGIGQV